MHRIDTEGNTTGTFSDGNPQTGQPGTLIDAAFWQDLQETICRAIEAAGIPLAKGNYDQLAQVFASYGKLTGATFTGTVNAPNFIVNSAGFGGISMTTGDATHTGVVSFTKADGSRAGYVGFITPGSAVQYGNDSSSGHAFVGGVIRRDGNPVWDSGNDGAGSGLDADLLDGLDSTAFARWTGGNFTGTILRSGFQIWDSGNDGSGSGLDADLLDGLDSSYFVNIPARLGYTPANRAGDTFTGSVYAPNLLVTSTGIGGVSVTTGDATHSGVVSFVAANGSRAGFVGFITSGGAVQYGSDSGAGHVFTGGSLRRDGNPVWDSGNDGAGSGLDADLLDGLDSTAFAKISDFVSSLGDTGYQQLPSGLIIQWGTTIITAGANTLQAVTLPRAYPAAQLNVVGNSASVNSTGGAIIPPGGSTTQIQVYATNNGASISWISIGR